MTDEQFTASKTDESATPADRLVMPLQRLRAGEYGDGAKVEFWSFSRQRMDDVCELAAAYLAEHDEDEHEPITEDWLIAAGVSGTIDMGGSFWFRIYPHLGTIEIGSTNDCGYYGWDEELELPPVETRGDVRRVCKTLGIPIKGGSDD
jgi:hypothetical protein